VERGGKKTAAAVHQEIARELDNLMPRIFADRRKTGEFDFEAVELAFRTALHSAGAAGLTELLRQPVLMAVGERAISAGPVGGTPPTLDGGEWTSPV
jgi:hypothetical protein